MDTESIRDGGEIEFHKHCQDTILSACSRDHTKLKFDDLINLQEIFSESTVNGQTWDEETQSSSSSLLNGGGTDALTRKFSDNQTIRDDFQDVLGIIDDIVNKIGGETTLDFALPGGQTSKRIKINDIFSETKQFTINDFFGTLTLKLNNNQIGTFYPLQSGDINIQVPNKTITFSSGGVAVGNCEVYAPNNENENVIDIGAGNILPITEGQNIDTSHYIYKVTIEDAQPNAFALPEFKITQTNITKSVLEWELHVVNNTNANVNVNQRITIDNTLYTLNDDTISISPRGTNVYQLRMFYGDEGSKEKLLARYLYTY